MGNEDEDNHSQSTEAMEAMLEDRDETYENFIRLEYGYTAEEKKARNGYTIHGTHRDGRGAGIPLSAPGRGENGSERASEHP